MIPGDYVAARRHCILRMLINTLRHEEVYIFVGIEKLNEQLVDLSLLVGREIH